MRLIIAGGRDYALTDTDRDFLDRVHRELGITEVVHGGCSGADMGGAAWAAEAELPVRVFPVSTAEWKEVGPSAGPKRNHRMAQYAGASDAPYGFPGAPAALVLFPGGRGTLSMFNVALLFPNIKVFDRRTQRRAAWTDEHFGEIAWPGVFKRGA